MTHNNLNNAQITYEYSQPVRALLIYFFRTNIDEGSPKTTYCTVSLPPRSPLLMKSESSAPRHCKLYLILDGIDETDFRLTGYIVSDREFAFISVAWRGEGRIGLQGDDASPKQASRQIPTITTAAVDMNEARWWGAVKMTARSDGHQKMLYKSTAAAPP